MATKYIIYPQFIEIACNVIDDSFSYYIICSLGHYKYLFFFHYDSALAQIIPIFVRCFFSKNDIMHTKK